MRISSDVPYLGVRSLLTIGISAYLEVRDDKSDTNWLLLDYESEKSDKLKLSQVGTGGLNELREALDDSKASYAYVRITYANDKESTRQKFIFVVRHPIFFLFHDSQAQ